MRHSLFVLVLLAPASTTCAAPTFSIELGPVNGVLIENDGHRIAIYGWKAEDATNFEHVLLAHGRRDLVWKAKPLAAAGASVIAPTRERYSLENPVDFWNRFTTARFHDYAQQSTKLLGSPLSVDRWVKEGDTIPWRGLMIRTVETPGYTRGAVSYIAHIDNQKVAFTGDLIYGDGQVLDLYSFQDAIPTAQIRGYHGYGSRLAELVASLQKIAAEQPDVIVPARGPIIRDPAAAIERLIGRVRSLYRNYLSTNALHWYFKEERMRTCGQRVLGAGANIELMPYAHHEQTPAWVFEHSTSRLLISETGHGFLLDCGYQRVIDAINDLIANDVIKQIDGIFVTHYHDDHTDMVQAAADGFQCPVYATQEYADVLERPEAYHLPAMTANPIHNIQVLPNGHQMKWHEFTLTFHFFPGQTYYHGALFAKKPGDKPIFFIGDAFAPSGIDDYCVLNRNLLHNDSGYLLCLNKIRAVQEPFWLVNEHIAYVFSFSPVELDYIEKRYRERIAMMRELFPWDDPNYGIDERWAVFYPYGATVAPGKTVPLEMRITNHSPVERTFKVTPRIPTGWQLSRASATLRLPARESGSIKLPVTSTDEVGIFLVTADVESDGMEFREWAEALITVE